jgi:hypothetical protein
MYTCGRDPSNLQTDDQKTRAPVDWRWRKRGAAAAEWIHVCLQRQEYSRKPQCIYPPTEVPPDKEFQMARGGSMVTNIGKGEGAICPGLRCLLWLGWVSNSKLELICLSINHIRFSLTFVSMCQVKAWLPYVLHNTSADNNVHNSRLQSWHQDALRRGVWIRIVFTRGGGSNSMVLKSSVNSPRS